MKIIDEYLKEIEKSTIIFLGIILMLIFIIFVITTWKFGSVTELVNQISFASGITSLILAVVAIFYAYIQGKDSRDQNLKTTDVLNNINSKIGQLEIMLENYKLVQDISKKLIAIQGNDNVGEIHKTVVEAIDELSDVEQNITHLIMGSASSKSSAHVMLEVVKKD